MKTNYKKYVPHTLGAVLLLGVLGWLAWLTVKGTSKEGMDNNDDLVNAMEIWLRLNEPLSSDLKYFRDQPNVASMPPVKKTCFINAINNNMSSLLEIPRLRRENVSVKDIEKTPILQAVQICNLI